MWKLSGGLNQLPSDIKNADHLRINSDELGDIWAVQSEKGNALLDRKSNRILHQTKTPRVWNLTPNGKYLSARDGDGELSETELYRVSGMTKLTTPKGFREMIGKGRFAVVEQKNGQRAIVDVESPTRSIKNVDATWGGNFVLESEDGSVILKTETDGMALYGLPSFRKIQSFPDMMRGIPFMNPAGNILGSRAGDVVYLRDRSSGKTKNYGLDPENLNLLLEVTKVKRSIHAISGGKVVALDQTYFDEEVTKVWNLSDLSIVQSADASDEAKVQELTKKYLDRPYAISRHNVVGAILFPPNSADFWVLFNSSKSERKGDDQDGDSVLVNIGGDLEIKRALYYSKQLMEAAWDEETSSIVGRTPDNDEYVSIQP